MKKLFVLLSLIVFTLTLAGQSINRGTTPQVFGQNQYYQKIPGAATDTLSVNGDSTGVYITSVNKPDDLYYRIGVSMDSISGTPDFDIYLTGRILSTDSWSALSADTATWDGTTSDTVVVFNDFSTGTYFREIKLNIDGQAGTGTAELELLEHSFKKK